MCVIHTHTVSYKEPKCVRVLVIQVFDNVCHTHRHCVIQGTKVCACCCNSSVWQCVYSGDKCAPTRQTQLASRLAMQLDISTPPFLDISTPPFLDISTAPSNISLRYLDDDDTSYLHCLSFVMVQFHLTVAALNVCPVSSDWPHQIINSPASLQPTWYLLPGEYFCLRETKA